MNHHTDTTIQSHHNPVMQHLNSIDELKAANIELEKQIAYFKSIKELNEKQIWEYKKVCTHTDHDNKSSIYRSHYEYGTQKNVFVCSICGSEQ